MSELSRHAASSSGVSLENSDEAHPIKSNRKTFLSGPDIKTGQPPHGTATTPVFECFSAGTTVQTPSGRAPHSLSPASPALPAFHAQRPAKSSTTGFRLRANESNSSSASPHALDYAPPRSHRSTQTTSSTISKDSPSSCTAKEGASARFRFATLAYRADRDLLTVQRLLGHASVQTTQRYAEPPHNALRRAVRAADIHRN